MLVNDLESLKKIWISWENHRRTRELSKAFGAKLYVFSSCRYKILRYILASFYTLRVLIKEKPQILFVQNPSLVLAAFVSGLKKLRLFDYILIVDRHTNFRLGKKPSLHLKSLLFYPLSNLSLRVADLTIVTNDFLKNLVEKKGGNGFVLPDKIPSLKKKNKLILEGKWNIVYICTFAPDEPYLEVFKAAKIISNDIFIYVTGDYSKLAPNILTKLPQNLVLTGYLSEQQFVDILFEADVIMDLTTAEWCLVCGGHEALAAEKPFITSNKKVLTAYFYKGAIFTENNAEVIAKAIEKALFLKNKLKDEVKELKKEKMEEWYKKFNVLRSILKELSSRRCK